MVNLAHRKTMNMIDTKTQQLQFPQHIDLKIIIDAAITIDDSKTNIASTFDNCKTEYRFVSVRASVKGNYYSFTYNIRLESKPQMDLVYSALKAIPGLKFAL